MYANIMISLAHYIVRITTKNQDGNCLDKLWKYYGFCITHQIHYNKWDLKLFQSSLPEWRFYFPRREKKHVKIALVRQETS